MEEALHRRRSVRSFHPDALDLATGLYRCRPRTHVLVPAATGDRRQAVAEASLGQGWMPQAPVLLVVDAEVPRTAGRYGDRATQYVHMEVGHAAQSVYLQATALGLGTTVVGAFQDGALARVPELRPGEVPLAVLPVGRPR